MDNLIGTFQRYRSKITCVLISYILHLIKKTYSIMHEATDIYYTGEKKTLHTKQRSPSLISSCSEMNVFQMPIVNYQQLLDLI